MRDEVLLDHMARSEHAAADRQCGAVTKYITPRGYGFIQTDAGADIFFHINNLAAGQSHIGIGDRVSFDVAVSSRPGKPEAMNVMIIEE